MIGESADAVRSVAADDASGQALYGTDRLATLGRIDAPPIHIRLRNVTKTYWRGSQPVDVLHDIMLDVAAGRFLALMGPSGSGKTTLLNLIGGLDSPSGGCVEVGGLRIDAMRPAALTRWRAANVGFVFQFYNLMPALSAQENVELPLLLTGMGSAQRRRNAAIALELVGLQDRGRHRPGELSGGQRQRVGIARAIVTDPTLLVCDEPTGDLDREAADGVLQLLERLSRDHHKTIVMVTHDPNAASHAHQTVLLEKGSLIASGNRA